MADTDVRSGQNEAVPSGKSYKAKLLQPSKNDELSVPDEPELPVLPPVKDAGSPPMTVTEAPAGAVEPDSDKVAHTEGATERAGINIKSSGASDDSAASGRTAAAAAANDETASGGAAGHMPIPDATEKLDSNLPGEELSDVEKEAISDPSTAELVAAATGDASAAVINEEPAPANVITVQPDESSDVTKIESDISAVLPGPGSKAGAPVVTRAEGTAAADGDTKPAGAGVAAAYGHLQQAPAAAGDAAAEPAAAALPSGGNRTSSSGGRVVEGGDITNNSGDVAAAAVPEPAVGVEKEGDLVADAATGVGSGPGDVLADSATADAAAADDSSDQNPLAAAAAAVAKPVAAAITDLKDVLLGPDITIGHGHEDHSSKE
jgi:hypothetical protein